MNICSSPLRVATASPSRTQADLPPPQLSHIVSAGPTSHLTPQENCMKTDESVYNRTYVPVDRDFF
jgi:hypothetical protein